MRTKETRYFVRSFLSALCVFLLVTIQDAQAQDAPRPLNVNGSFENTEPGILSPDEDLEGWKLNVGSSITEPPVFEIVEDPVQHGSRALKVLVNQTGDNAWDVEAAADSIPVVPGTTYRFSIWARAEGSGGTASFTVGNYSFNEYGRIGSERVTLTDEWQEFTFTFRITDQETYIRAPIHFSFAGNVGDAVYIDNLRIYDPNFGRTPIIVEAESGELGGDFEILEDEDDGASYIAIQTNFIDVSYPGPERTATFEVTFPDSGWYDLYARIRIGPSQFDDDSFFYANSFGARDETDPDLWTIVNNIVSAGFTEDDDFVTGRGSASFGVWKWLNLSENNFDEDPDSFYVHPDSLTQTFQIGAREDGLDIDKIAFARSNLFFTVENLNNGEAGVDELPDDTEPLGPPLAEGTGKWLGSAYSGPQVEDFEAYWNQVTPENAGKWGSVEGRRDTMNWAELDAAYELAKENGMAFRLHVLLWGNQQPGWIADLPVEEQREEIEEWFTAVAERYPDLDYVEVVNEPLHDPPDDPEDGGYIEALGGTGETGWDWVITAFEMAREIFPETTKLLINDYNILSSMNNARRYVQLVRLLQERGLIDGIGVQGHAFSTRGPVAGMVAVLDTLAATGLPIQVTEMDVDGNPNEDDSLTDEESDQNQLETMQRIFPALWAHPAVEGITFWGWRPGLWRHSQEAYLVRPNGEERPALVWLRGYLQSYALPAEPGAEVPQAFRLLGNYPNPFNPTTRIRYELAEPAEVTLKVFDLLGRQVQTLVSAYQVPGEYTVTFDARDLSSGVYLYRLEAGSFVQTRPMLLVK